MKKRNYNIDFLRGIATISIIVIHTAFWSGTAYLPEWVSNITLLLDVPAFIFISGITSSYSKTFMKKINGLLKLWQKWIFFLLFYILILLIFFRSDLKLVDIINWIFYSFPRETHLTVVQGSIWFMIMYIKVTILSATIITLNNYFEKSKKNRLDNIKKIILLLLLIFSYTSLSKNTIIFDSYTYFYLIIYLIGYLSINYKISLKQMIKYQIINLILLLIVLYAYKYNINDFQTVKFPPSFPYIFVSAPSIILYWYLKDHLSIKKNNKINYIGINAIDFYFAQGISSSLIYYIYRYIPFSNKLIIFIIMLTCNFIITTIIAIIINKSYNYVKIKLMKK